MGLKIKECLKHGMRIVSIVIVNKRTLLAIATIIVVIT
jgi:hypothetical protein